MYTLLYSYVTLPCAGVYWFPVLHTCTVPQMANPEMRQMLTNPEAMRAMMQIQQGMATLQQTAPGLLRPAGG